MFNPLLQIQKCILILQTIRQSRRAIVEGGNKLYYPWNLTFRDALHAPDITANLLSISKMDLAGWDAVFGNGRVRFLSMGHSA